MKVLGRVLCSVITAAVVAALGACSPTISVDAAVDATDPACGLVLARTPTTLDGLKQRQTTSQATTAWGDAGAAITLRCGVNQPPPSPDCLSISYGDVSMDWISEQTATGWRFTTYGRVPAIEVNVPDSLGLTQPGLTDLAPALEATTVTATCQ